MKAYLHIIEKLEAFLRKYYTRLLLKGLVLFSILASLLFLLITGVEYLLWLPKTMRLALFWASLVLMAILLYRYILTPILFLFKVKKGLSHQEASVLIGKHFPAVGDRLLNLMDLQEQSNKTDLLEAAIAQRSYSLGKVPFTDAVSFKDSYKLTKWLAVPLGILLLLWLSGRIGAFFNSAQRVVNYEVAYEAPAPFQFVLENKNLAVLGDRPLTIGTQVVGDLRPEEVFITIDGSPKLMKNLGEGRYSYTLELPLRDLSFRFSGGAVTSRSYELNVLDVPSIIDFKIKVEQPSYLGDGTEIIKGNGNLNVPEGSKLSWQISALATDAVAFVTKDTTRYFNKDAQQFLFTDKIWSNTAYQLTTSNAHVKEYEFLAYAITVIKDKAPKVRVAMAKDSVAANQFYFSGSASDDYGLTKVDLVYYVVGEEGDSQRFPIWEGKQNFNEFFLSFPGNLPVLEGKSYAMYFEVVDNDAQRGGKRTKSKVFNISILAKEQVVEQTLEQRKELLKDLDRGLDKIERQNELLEELNKTQKEESVLSFKDQAKVKDFLKQQKEQEALMEQFSKQLKENIEKGEILSEQDQLLKERLERQELQAKKNQKLLEELSKVADKIKKEELQQKLEELTKSQHSNKRNLRQLLELTKQYYVKEKAAQVGQQLEVLSKKQELLSKLKLGEDLDDEEQSKLNQEFNKISKDLDELKGDNRSLRKPMDLGYNKNQQESIKKDQEGALEEINKHQGDEKSGKEDKELKQSQDKVSQKQKSAARKMQEMSESLQQGAAAGGGGDSGMVEDAEMLRQILDNLIQFSFQQEHLMEGITIEGVDLEAFSGTIKRQKELRRLFEHVDDSLFALSLRRAELSEFVNEQIGEVFYNVDEALVDVAENQMYQAVSHQQYVVSAANTLADFLANVMENMQQSMSSGQGQGQGEGFQLPDIIKSQQEVQKQMQGSGKKGGKKEGQQGQEGQQGESGQQGQQGQAGQSGQEGQQGQQGQGGDQGGQGKNGEGKGKNGQQGGKAGQSGQNGSNKNNRSDAKGNRGKGNQGGDGGQGGSGLSEAQLQEIYEIYQQQQAIRQALEEQLKNIINKEERSLAKKLSLQMEQFENELLENGITQRTITKANHIQQQLLKLENAALEQGKKKQRQSNTNQKTYKGISTGNAEQYFKKDNTIENLNRQALPLRAQFLERIKNYFEQRNQF